MSISTDVSSHPSQRLDRLLQHMDASHLPPPTTSNHTSHLPPRHTTNSYSTSLTSHHTTATPDNHTSTPSAANPFPPRRLQRADYGKGFLSLLSQLTDVGDVSEHAFCERFDELSRVSDTQQVWVIEDVERGRVIGTATLLVELKFIHGVSKVSGHGRQAGELSRFTHQPCKKQSHAATDCWLSY